MATKNGGVKKRGFKDAIYNFKRREILDKLVKPNGLDTSVRGEKKERQHPNFVSTDSEYLRNLYNEQSRSNGNGYLYSHQVIDAPIPPIPAIYQGRQVDLNSIESPSWKPYEGFVNSALSFEKPRQNTAVFNSTSSSILNDKRFHNGLLKFKEARENGSLVGRDHEGY